MDYTDIAKRLEEMRKHSQDYLKRSLAMAAETLNTPL
jgi:hypothetical protein